jgi:hypothetical protein
MPEVPGNWPAVVEALVNSAFQYGPFFFSIWFLYAFARWSYRNYQSVLNNRRIDLKERAQHWTYFVGSTIFGCLLVVVSTAWWIVNKPNTYVFDGQISGFAETDSISSPDPEVYIRELRDRTGEMEIYFVTIGNEPFGKGQNFRIFVKHSADQGLGIRRSNPLLIEYDGHSHGKFSFSGDKLYSLRSAPLSANKE